MGLRRQVSLSLERRLAKQRTPAMDDGTQVKYGPGDAFYMPPGHDAWIGGDKRCVLIDFTGVAKYAKARWRTLMPAVSMSACGGKADISDWLADDDPKRTWRVRPIADLTVGKKPL